MLFNTTHKHVHEKLTPSFDTLFCRLLFRLNPCSLISVMEWSEAEEDGRRFNLFLTSSLKDLAFFSILDPEAFSKKK